MKLALVLLAALLLLSACVENRFLYYGDTSQRYYRAVKSPDPSSIAAYKGSLEEVFSKSEKKGLPVPPGLYCDYAMILVNEGNLPLAREYFEREKAQWSESAQLMDFLMSRYGLTH